MVTGASNRPRSPSLQVPIPPSAGTEDRKKTKGNNQDFDSHTVTSEDILHIDDGSSVPTVSSFESPRTTIYGAPSVVVAKPGAVPVPGPGANQFHDHSIHYDDDDEDGDDDTLVGPSHSVPAIDQTTTNDPNCNELHTTEVAMNMTAIVTRHTLPTVTGEIVDDSTRSNPCVFALDCLSRCNAVSAIVCFIVVLTFLAITQGNGSNNSYFCFEPADLELLFGQRVLTITTTISLQQQNSPQCKALNWLCNGGTTCIDQYSIDQRVQRYALATVYYSIATGDHLPNSWLSYHHECDWLPIPRVLSISCNQNDEIVRIDALDDVLTGRIPVELSLLTDMTSLTVSIGELTGTLPTEIGLLQKLNYLSLPNNQLRGTIPTELGLLQQLTTLYLFQNNMNGTIPTEIGMLSKLQYLQFRSNQLMGTIPSQLGQLSQLTSLHLFDNLLTGAIPNEVCHLQKVGPLSHFRGSCTNQFPCHCCTHCCNDTLASCLRK